MKQFKGIGRFIFFCTILVVLLFGSTILVQASVKKDAMKAYNDQLKKTSGTLKFAIIYLDNDSVPELVINDGRIFSYKKGRGIFVLNDDYEFDYKSYYKKKGVIYSDIIFGAVSNFDVGYYSRVSGGKLVTLAHFNHYHSGKTVYFNGNYRFTEISKAAYDALIKKYVKNKKPTKIKYYKNTAGNRKKILK